MERAHTSGVVADPAPAEVGPALGRSGAVGSGGWARPAERIAGAARGAVAGRLSLAVIVLCALAIVAEASAGPTALVSRSPDVFPPWEAGPLAGVTRQLISHPLTVDQFSAILVLMAIAYVVLLGAVGSLSGRLVIGAIVVLHAILLLGPPVLLSDLLNYLGFARLAAVHGLNPYAVGIGQEHADPIYRLTTWHGLRSPYGELFTALSEAVALLPLTLAFWVLKVVTVLMSLATVGLVWACARRLGRDPVRAVAFMALNPLYLMFAVAGFHNDFFMLVPSLAAIWLLLGGRDRAAGASLLLAVAVKFTAILLGPFLLVAVGCAPRRRRLLEGALLMAVPVVALSLLLFGTALPDVGQQSALLTNQSVPNLVTWLAGFGGATPLVLKAADALVLATLAWQLLRRRDWLTGAGWTTFALVLSFGWVVPWYVAWLLPLAALCTSAWLRRASVILTVYLLVAFLPATPGFLARHHINPLNTSAGRTSHALERRLAY